MLSKHCWGALSVIFSCASDTPAVAVLRQALDDGCIDAPAHVSGDALAILSSIEPLDPLVPQAYGDAACGGFVFEFQNPDGEPLHGAWVQASGPSQDAADMLSEARCPERTLQADYWGYVEKNKEWTKLAAAELSGAYMDPHCKLDAILLHEGSFDKLRVVTRVTQDSATYPVLACLW